MCQTRLILILLLATAAIAGCCLIDEDLSECGTECKLDYELQLVTNITTELQTQLNMETEISVAAALKTFLANVFTDHAHDVDLSFYDVKGDSTLLHRESHIMNASQSSYTLHIPVRNYMHLAVANIEDNSQVSVESSESCHSARLSLHARDTVESLNTGVFTARLPINMQEGVDQKFNVSLFMAGCASALVLDTLGSKIKDLKVYATGFADSFSIADSTWHYDRLYVVRTQQVQLDPEENSGLMCFADVTFPSKDIPETKTVIETTDPFVSEDAEDALWQLHIYATLPNGSVTKTVFGIKQPLRPGQVKVIRATVYDDGSSHTHVPYVGASVTLDWNTGNSHEIEM